MAKSFFSSSVVTVVIPAYNAGHTIGRALDSVASQTSPVCRVIVVDDASIDGTPELVSRHPSNRMMEIEVHRLPRNSGVSSARNCGWDKTRTEFVAFLDADDHWHPLKLECQLPLMVAGAAMSGHDVVRIDNPVSPNAILPVTMNDRRVGLELLFRNVFTTTSSIVLRTSLLYRFDERLSRCEDFLLWCQLMLDGLEIRKLRAPLASYFKAPYGESGLSQDTHAMERAEREVLALLRSEGRIGSPLYLASITASRMRALCRSSRN